MRAALFLVLTSLLWSGNFVISRATNADIGPLTLSTARWCVVAALLLPWTIYKLKLAKLTLLQYLKIALMAILAVSCYNTFVYIGLQYTTAPNGVLFNSTIPFWVLLVGATFLGKKLSKNDIIGMLLSLLGVVILVTHGHWKNILALDFSKGDLWIIAAASCWGTYTAMLPRWRPAELDVLSYLGILASIGVLFIAILRWFNPYQEPALVWSMQNILVILYVSIFASIVAWVMFIQGVKAVGPEIGGQTIHLMPVFVAVLAYIFLDEKLYRYHYIGATFILLGLICTNHNRSKVSAAKTTPTP
jgi:drug/metabolite transporter (DMT)-like permease